MLLEDDNRSLDLINLEDSEDIVVVRFNKAAESAKNLIDSYLTNYTLPLTEVPGRIIELSDDITLFNIHKRRHPENIPDSITGLYRDAIKTLQSIQAGQITLNIPTKVQSTDQQQGIFKVNTSKSDFNFSKDKMGKY